MKPYSIATIAIGLWLIFALAIDRLLLSAYCPVCANILSLDLKVKLPAAELAYPPVSLLVLIVVPMIMLAFYLVPWRQLRSPSAWREAFSLWCQPWFWLLVAVALAVLGESIFIAAKDYIPNAIANLAEKFSVTASLSVAVPGFKETTPLALTASLSGFIGLALGSYLFLKKGVKEVLTRA